MYEPDFDQIAFRAEVERILAPAINTQAPYVMAMLDIIAEGFAAKLRQVWNARGAADLEAIDAAVGAGVDTRIAHALTRLDR